MCQQQMCPSNAVDMSHMATTSCAHKTALSDYILHMVSMQSIIWPGSLVYLHFTLLTWPWTNMPTTLHKHVQLHFYYSLHIDPILLHTSIKNLQNMCQQLISLSNATNMTYALITQTCIYEEGMPNDMPYMKLLPLLM